ncbi:MAG: iron-containing redox enzyme family protein [Nocardioides sp.]
MRLPSPRGPLTAGLFPALRGISPLPVDELVALVGNADCGTAELEDDDVHSALWVAYQLHYTGFDEVDHRWEWDPDLLRVRRALEDRFLAELRVRTADLVQDALQAEGSVADRLFAMTETFEAPALAAYLRRDATRDEMFELLVQRSIHNLQESDPQAFLLPRVGGAPKVALAELLFDEFGAGRPERLHSGLFARGLAECGLDDEPGAYASVVPGVTLAFMNGMNLFALHRGHTAAALGHFGAYEATSSVPSRLVVAAVERLQFPASVRAYFDEHVEADAVHEQLAFRDICGGFAEADPAAVHDLFFGAAVCLVTDADVSRHLLLSWGEGRSSLATSADALVPSDQVA